MVKEITYYETSDGKRFEKFTDAQKHENEITDPLHQLIDKLFDIYTIDAKSNIRNIIEKNQDEFIRVLMKDKLDCVQTKVDTILSRLHEERKIPQEKCDKRW